MKRLNCILFIDDFEADNYYNLLILKEADVCDHIKFVLNGCEAIEYLKKSGENDHSGSFPVPDIIFLDINMPRMNGFEFLEEYQRFDERLKSSIIMIILTTTLSPDDRRRAVQYTEVKEFFIKPLAIGQVHELLDKYF